MHRVYMIRFRRIFNKSEKTLRIHVQLVQMIVVRSKCTETFLLQFAASDFSFDDFE